MDNNVADVLSAVHALTSYDTTSKVGAKSAAFQAEKSGKSEVSDQMILLAEKF